MTNNYFSRVKETAGYLKKAFGGRTPEIFIIMGSGLADAFPPLENSVSTPYGKIPNFPSVSVKGHKGEIVFGNFAGKNVAVMRGRFHFYEGRDMGDIIFPVRVFKLMGARTAILTSAVGSLKKSIKPGTITVLQDHINMMGENPLRTNCGGNFGPFFADMSAVYDAGLCKIALSIARKLKINSRPAVYVGVRGPSFETPAEVKAFAKLGGDVVGMSTIPEACACAQLGIKVLALSYVSNMAACNPTHEEILANGVKSAANIKKLLAKFINYLHLP